MTDSEPALSSQQKKFSDLKRSPLHLYRELMIGKGSWVTLVLFELYQIFILGLPGLLGLGARSVCLPFFLSSCGRRPAIGRGVTIRRPNSIELGSGVLIDEGASLDARGDGARLEIGNNVCIGRGTIVTAKEGVVRLDSAVNIGTGCRIATQSQVSIGESTLVAAYCYIGPGNHRPAGEGKTLIEQEMDIRGGVTIGKHVWIGARATILDGVTIGDGAIIGAHSLVREDVPAGAVAVGTPARILSGG